MENAVEKVIGNTVIILMFIFGNLLLICTVKSKNPFNTVTVTYRLIINMGAAYILVTDCNMPGKLTRQITGRYHWFDGAVGVIPCQSASFISNSTVSCSNDFDIHSNHIWTSLSGYLSFKEDRNLKKREIHDSCHLAGVVLVFVSAVVHDEDPEN